MLDQITNRQWRILLPAAWLIVALVQGATAELFHDEALYWAFSQKLDWGYFDHPPMIALMIKIGYGLFESEFGVRLLTILANTMALVLMERMAKTDKPLIFYLLAFSMLVVHGGSVFAAPDSPLILFTVLFFMLYQRYLNEDHWKWSIAIGLVMACLLYSKYHGILIIVFSLLPNLLQLMRRWTAWVAIGVGVLAFLPHLIWQMNNDFVTFQFYLSDRDVSPFQWTDPLVFVASQFMVVGPIVTPLLYLGFFRHNQKTPFNGALKWGFIGVMGFFLLNSFWTPIEPNWTATATVPLLVVAYQYFGQQKSHWKAIKRVAAISLVVIMTIRADFMVKFLPFDQGIFGQTVGWERWAGMVYETANGAPVVFRNSYQWPSKYAFYTGGQAHSFNAINYSGNNWDIWPIEEELQGQRVMLMTDWDIKDPKVMVDNFGIERKYAFIDNFRSYNRVKIEVSGMPEEVVPGQTVLLNLRLLNTGQSPVDFLANPHMPSSLLIEFLDGKDPVAHQVLVDDLQEVKLAPNETTALEASFEVPALQGEYLVGVGIKTGWMSSGKNAGFKRLKIN